MTTRKYAPIGKALGECPRSGRKMLLRDMVYDGYHKGMLVDPKWYEPEHPQERLHKVSDVIQTKMQSPDLDNPETVVNFPTFDLNTGAVYGSFIERDYLGFDGRGLPGTVEFVWISSLSDIMVTDSGDTIIFAEFE